MWKKVIFETETIIEKDEIFSRFDSSGKSCDCFFADVKFAKVKCYEDNTYFFIFCRSPEIIDNMQINRKVKERPFVCLCR
jgi:hypothetical protein